MNELNVVSVAYDGLCTFEFGVVVEVFGLERPEFDRWYDFSVCSVDPGPLSATGGVRVEASSSLELLDRAGTIVIPGWRDPKERPPDAFLEKLRRAHDRGARLLSICSGVFALAAAGLLDGRRATTHWRYARLLSDRYPRISVDPDVLYVDEGSILTSAGSAAGIDLCLHLVRRDFGSDVVNTVARRLVVPPHRDGGQAQFIEAPVPEDSGDRFSELLDWLRRHLDEDHTVASIARRAHVSPRTLNRRFQSAVGDSPYRWLTRERVRLARRLLETTDHSIERIARLSGLGSAQALRLHFRRNVGTSPTTYRDRFRG